LPVDQFRGKAKQCEFAAGLPVILAGVEERNL
jgi:hypothetical protein